MIERQINSATKSRIYVIGFGRCGSTSLHEFFNKSGIKSMHDNLQCMEQILYNLNNNLPVCYGYEEYQAIKCGRVHKNQYGIYTRVSSYFRVIAKQDSDALFVLNTRNIDNWIDSMSLHPSALKSNKNKLIDRYASECNLKSRYQAELHLRTRWYAHMASVRHYFSEDRLLIFDIERDDPVKLCNFLGLDKKYCRYWGKHNRSIVYKSEIKLLSILVNNTPQLIKNIFPYAFKRKIIQILKDKKIRGMLSRIDNNAIVRI